MSRKFEFSLNFDEGPEKYLKNKFPEMQDFRVLSQSLDARGAPRGRKPKYLYKVEIIQVGESFEDYREDFKKVELSDRPIIIGAGPAGLFAALRFSEYGVKTVLIERGDEASSRMKKIARYWRYGVLDSESNVCFGEGGAGLFSDGKLMTRVKSPYIHYVMEQFVKYGAPENIAYTANPHLGSNKIRGIITNLSSSLKKLGHDLVYNDAVDTLIYKKNKVIGVKLKSGKEILSSHIILATGHSAKNIYHDLYDNQVDLKTKSFAMGVRIEHPRHIIDSLQHGKWSDSQILGSARYRLSWENPDSKRGTYSFCMCPGGHVLSSGTEENGLVTNGMSNSARNSPWSNAALVVTVEAEKDLESNDPLEGLRLQELIEERAYNISKEKATGRELPCMSVKEFLANKIFDKELPKTSTPSGLIKTNIREIFPDYINTHLEKALLQFDHKLSGFLFEDALLIAPETRTSSPITILRNKETFESTSHKGLFPCGEGAGYAGGITSAAVDGVKVVEAIIQKLS